MPVTRTTATMTDDTRATEPPTAGVVRRRLHARTEPIERATAPPSGPRRERGETVPDDAADGRTPMGGERDA
ncbi:hypothetical protein C475_11179 [Halosimplex carlsbadense 2-9-1]|uniref:Uncharacterized protein n=1 Tax=Halosimplex carlsbadense 2-9-1 TaxID=797114 RepID=M0CPC1_9EURY|nr:hypothetical protein C475_11179 [Halosimplex carlsbadense 2-9-1]